MSPKELRLASMISCRKLAGWMLISEARRLVMLLERTLCFWRGDLVLYLPRATDASLPFDVLAVSSELVNLICLSLPESVERLGVRAARATAASGRISETLPISSAASDKVTSSVPICPSSAVLTSSP